MARQHDPVSLLDFMQPLEAWVLPLTAAIIVGGVLVFSSLAGMFWLVIHPAPRSTVIWMQSPTTQSSTEVQTVALGATTALEDSRDARTN